MKSVPNLCLFPIAAAVSYTHLDVYKRQDKYFSLDRTPLQKVDFAALFEEHLKPFEFRYEETKTVATELWRCV